jgi:Sulfatase
VGEAAERAARPVQGRSEPTGPVVDVSVFETSYFLGLMVVLPTLLLLALNQVIGLLGAAINIDFLILYPLSILVARRSPGLGVAIAGFGAAAILSVQLSMGLGLIYIENPALIPEYLRFLPLWPWKVIGLWAGVGLAGVSLFVLLLRWRSLARARIAPALILLALVLVLDLLGRTAVGYDLLRANLATSSAVRFSKLAVKWSQPADLKVGTFPGATMKSDLASLAQPPDRVLSVAVESFGLAHEPSFNAQILAPLIARVSGSYGVEVRRHAYHGATLAGEIRELCGLKISGTPTTAEASRLRGTCLPAQLSARGFATLGIHGNSRFFYNRGELYPTIGFAKELFYANLLADRRSVCKTRAFSGICDRDALAAALDFGRENSRSFVHVMTLDSHFPLGSRTPGDRDCPAGQVAPTDELCLYSNQMAKVMDTIGQAIASAAVKPDLVYIYGDHAPPYAIASDRAFFDRKNVPFIVLHRRPPGDPQ